MSVKIIAEAGSNHNGKLSLALQLVDAAKEAKADYVKFQIINPKTLYVPYYWKGDEKIENIVYSRREMEGMSYNEWRTVNDYARDKEIKFTSSIFDNEGADFLASIGVPFIKLASSDLNNIALIEHISKMNMMTIISTGMSSMDEIKNSVETFSRKGNLDKLVVLHCVSVYPCALENTKLWKIEVLKKELGCKIGFSDHTQNSIAACASLSKGVSYIEKHFTLDKNMDGFDHKYASSPSEFKEYVQNIRQIENSLNFDDSKTGEEITKIRARRGLYLNKKYKKGEIIRKEHIVALRPSNKFAPENLPDLVGLKAGKDISEYQSLVIKGDFVVPDIDTGWEEAAEFWKKEMKEKKMLK